MFGRKIRPKAEKAKAGLRKILKKIPVGLVRSDKVADLATSSSKETVENDTVDLMPQEAVAPKSGLRITVTARFELPVDYTNSHTYQTSPAFVGSEKICRALVNRIQHCANELITRRDPDAAQPLLSSPPHIKDARYHLIFQVERDGQPWAQQYFACFQKQPMDAAAARKVIFGTDRIISLFLQRHDPGFHWELPPIVSEEQAPHTTYVPTIGCAQPLDCIPDYSGMPGYTIEISLKTQHRGQHQNWEKNIESRQNSPLTLHAGEGLMAKVQDTIQRAFEQREALYDESHFGCNGLEGTGGCQHYEEDAFGLEVKLRNNIGPEFSHFHYNIRTFQVLFPQDQTAEFEEFVELLEGNVEDLRDETDAIIGSLDDFRVQIQQLSCKDWTMERPVAVSLDCSITECRTTIEAVLERVESGLKKTLQSQGLSAAVTAHKRGHLVMDTFIQGGEPETTISQIAQQPQSETESRLGILKQLRERIGQDIAAVCKDTCNLEEVGFMINLKISASASGEEDNLSKYSTTPPVSICLSQRRVVKKARNENLRAASPELSSSPEREDQSNIMEGRRYMVRMVSARSCISPTSTTPSLADIDSIHPTDGVTTPVSARKSSTGDQWGVHPRDAATRTFSKSTRGSNMSGTYTEEPSVIHHSSHLGDATLRLLENLDKGNPETPSPSDKPREVSWGQHSSASNDSATIAVLSQEQQFTEPGTVLQVDIYDPPKAPQETTVSPECEVEQPDLDVCETPEGEAPVDVLPDSSSTTSDAPYTTSAPKGITPVIPRKSSARNGDQIPNRNSFLGPPDFGNPLRIFSSPGPLGLPPACTKIHAEGHIPRSQVSSLILSDVE